MYNTCCTSDVKVFSRKKNCSYFVYSQYFEFVYCGYCEYSHCFEVLYAYRRYLWTRRTSGFATAVDTIILVLKYFRVLYCGYLLQILAVFRPLVLRVLRVLPVPKYSQCTQYIRSLRLRPSVHCCVENWMPVF